MGVNSHQKPVTKHYLSVFIHFWLWQFCSKLDLRMLISGSYFNSKWGVKIASFRVKLKSTPKMELKILHFSTI